MPKSKKSSTKTVTKSSSKSKSNMDKLDMKNKDYNLVKVKSKMSGVILFSIVINVVFAIVLGYIVHYLNKLKECDCFKDRNEEVKANIDYLIIIEVITLIFLVLGIIMLIYIYSNINSIKSGGSNTNVLFIVFTLINLAIYGFFIFNVYKLSQIVNKECECTIKPIRYILYIQTFFIVLYFISLIMGLFRM